MNLGHEGHWYDGLLVGVTGGAVLAVLAKTVDALGKVVPMLIQRRREINVVTGITDQSPVYLEMERAVKEDGARRVIMLSGHNCGSKPQKGKPFYVSAIHVVADTIEHRQRASAYKDQIVDSFYTDMIGVLFRDGFYHFKMDSEPKDSVLREFYVAEGVTDSLICYLREQNNAIIFISFAKFDGLFTTKEMHNFKMRAMNIREELKR